MKLDRAGEFGVAIVDQLRPYCERIAVAGSVRRKRPEVKDLEIVCIPRRAPTAPMDLFGGGVELQREQGFVAMVDGWRKTKGKAADGRYMQRTIGAGEVGLDGSDEIVLDLFTATAENWGLIYAIRTGPADYSHRVLARGWVRAGYQSVGGYLRRRDELAIVPVPEEADLFRLIMARMLPPSERG